MSFSINIPGFNHPVKVNEKSDDFGNGYYSSVVRTPFGEFVSLRTSLDYRVSRCQERVWNTQIVIWGTDEDRVSCARPDEGILARSRSWYEALGAHILAVSCLCGCDVSVTEAFELQGDEMEVE